LEGYKGRSQTRNCRRDTGMMCTIFC